MKRHTDLLASSIMNDRGYTLIELLITIAILGILAGVAITSYVGVSKKAARSEAYSNLESLRLLEEQFYAENGNYTGTHADVAAIQGDMPGFRPGNNRIYDYSVITNVVMNNFDVPWDGTTSGSTPCFTGVATGVLGTRVCPIAAECDVFAIDCNNNRNF